MPFVVFMGFIGLDEVIRFLAGQGLFRLGTTTLYYIYPVKALIVAALLYGYRKHYKELRLKDLTNIPATLGAGLLGAAVFVLWIKMDWTFGSAGAPQGFNPAMFPERSAQIVMTVFRVFGAVLVVPLMEELFWRSFLIRYIINPKFESVPIGAFTWISFFITVVLFGLEHHYILAGVMAGVAYNLLLYRTRSLAQCVLAHAVTNLALAVYVIFTGEWRFW
jgi:CAAX prenyl protease-like protein